MRRKGGKSWKFLSDDTLSIAAEHKLPVGEILRAAYIDESEVFPMSKGFYMKNHPDGKAF